MVKKSERLELRLTKEDKAQLKKRAEEKGMSLSTYILWKLKEDQQLNNNRVI